jgi:prepilin-type N-terminal cleavage/methylation domain-containing protein
MPGFTIIELLAVMVLMTVLIALGAPALMNVLATYKMRSSAQQLEMLARQARFESIKLNQPTTVVADVPASVVFAYSGTIPVTNPSQPPFHWTDVPPTQRVGKIPVARGVAYDFSKLQPACAIAVCNVFAFTPDGQGTGGDVILKGLDPNLPTYTISVAPATGKLTIH